MGYEQGIYTCYESTFKSMKNYNKIIGNFFFKYHWFIYGTVRNFKKKLQQNNFVSENKSKTISLESISVF